MQLRRLVALEVAKLEAELAVLRDTIAALEAILGDPVRAEAGHRRGARRGRGRARHAPTDRPGRRRPQGAGHARSRALEVADEPCDVVLSSPGCSPARPCTPTPTHADAGAPAAAATTSSCGRAHDDARHRRAGHLAGRVLRVGVLDLPASRPSPPGRCRCAAVRRPPSSPRCERGERVLGLARAARGRCRARARDPAGRRQAGRPGVAGQGRGRRGRRAAARRRGGRRRRARRRRGGAGVLLLHRRPAALPRLGRSGRRAAPPAAWPA